jgi:hypothetical protein
VSVGRAAQQLSTSVSGDNDPTYTQKKKGGDGGGRRRRGVGVRCGVDSNCSEGWGVEQRGVGHPAAALALSLSTFFTHRGNAATPAKESRRGNTARGWSWRSQQRRLEAHTHTHTQRTTCPIHRASAHLLHDRLHPSGSPHFTTRAYPPFLFVSFLIVPRRRPAFPVVYRGTALNTFFVLHHPVLLSPSS